MENNHEAIKEYTLERMKYALQKKVYLGTELNDIHAQVDFIADTMVIMMTGQVFGKDLPEIKYPTTWKEAAKDAFYAWLGNKGKQAFLKTRIKAKVGYYLYKIHSYLEEKHPVKHTRIDIKVLYPEINMPRSEIRYECRKDLQVWSGD